MARIEQSIVVNVPLSTAYNQWTQFEDFPRFMDGVREVKQIDDAHLHWRVHRQGREVEWESEITDQVPDQRIEWRDTSGPHHSGSISFQPLGANMTRVSMTMELELSADAGASAPQEIAERLGQDLERFKNLVELQGRESGAWRGEIHGAHATTGQGAQSARAGERQGATQAEGGSSSHPSGRWEAWTDETAFGDDTSGARSGAAGGHDAGAKAGAGAGEWGQREGRGGAAGGAGGPGRGGAQAWLRNQFPGLEEPIGMVRRMTEEMDQLFERFIGRPIASRFGQGQGGMAGKWMPQVEVVQLDDALLVCVDLPGIKREDVTVQVLHDRMTVEGERQEHSRSSAREGYRRSERSYGRFYRMIPLPHGVDPDHTSAHMQDGVLEVRIPMPAAARQPRKVDIS